MTMFSSDTENLSQMIELVSQFVPINFFVKKVLIYEQPQDFWDSGREDFKPNYFIPINIDKKIKLYNKLNSQVRGHRSTDHIETIAKLRGMQINEAHAEGFKIVRWVD